MSTKKTKTHTSSRKKASALAGNASRSKKTALKATTSKAIKSKTTKKKNDALERRRKREELTLKIFRWAYEANQRGEFQRL